MAQKQEFRADAYLCLNNWGGLEVEIDEAGERVRPRERKEQKPERWRKIYTNQDGSMYFIRHGLRWRLDEFMSMRF